MSPDVACTPLHGLHLRHGGRMVPFAGYAMPVQYPAGLMKEHLHTRSHAGLFDVSHMGQIRLTPHSGDVEDAARALETLLPIDVLGLRPGRQRYGLLLDASGGIRDDLMVAHCGDSLFLVVNAANKVADEAYLRAHLSHACKATVLARALVALQGPGAEAALSRLVPEVTEMRFMDVRMLGLLGTSAIVSRSGYTGEDGFEISVPEDRAEALAEALLADPTVLPIGLGARDSLRLEAGLCLHGNDIDAGTDPVEAGLSWAISAVRRRGGARSGGFPGAARILDALENGPPRKRVGLRPEGPTPVRAGAPLFGDETGEAIGHVTSGGFGPSLQAPIAMGYLPAALSTPGTRIFAEVRGKRLAVVVSALPFVPAGFKRA
ncbi:glycine cleavage system protein T [Methylobacterium sp. Leaf113]|uniref:glycine cleavage system aminomethyltransferase GcvT n=1 Tax=Methylobacterium sp. Leaf113 TaxID=1736259 RepID=UPI0006FBCA49|nr:glycine cleavage system aminomethyltransferase GcvT [Methylobacterium sp. Leaf113]KQP91233.1 glycine cleavage system protein T [Methylobacterium sp. Leaf113]